MALRTITLANTVDQWKTNYNSLATDVGDLSLLGTTHDSNLVLAINELIGEFDSATVQTFARKSISAGTGIGYDSSTGIITASQSYIRGSISASTGITYNSSTGAISATSANITTVSRGSLVAGTGIAYDSATGVISSTVSLTIPSNTITFAMMTDSSVGASELRNSAVTTVKIATGAVDSNALGALSVSSAKLQASIPDSKLATISTASKVSNSATTATNANTASAIVARDASGNFSAGTITAALSGNASTATTLATGRNFSLTGDVTATAVSFNGSLAVALSTTLASGVVSSTNLASAVTLIIYNSAGSALKTLYGAGS